MALAAVSNHPNALGNSSDQELLNREPDMKELLSSFLTLRNAYDRNHGPLPQPINAVTHKIKITGLVSNTLSLTLADLKSSFAHHEVTCALQCAGNRRHSMKTQLKREPQGIEWGDGAVMNCKWGGVLLADVLKKAGVKSASGLHVQFASHQQKCEEEGWFGGSVGLERCMKADAEVLLATEMNGTPLPHSHGAPIRIIVPGVLGARSVKWLDTVTISTEESPNHYQKRDYKILPPTVTDTKAAEAHWSKTPAMTDMPINSVIGIPSSDSTVTLDKEGFMEVKGYALPQGMSGPITKVEISIDGGKNWENASISGTPGKFTWALWSAKVKVPPGEGRAMLSRARDKGGNVQREAPKWNLRGVGFDGFGEVSGLKVVERK